MGAVVGRAGVAVTVRAWVAVGPALEPARPALGIAVGFSDGPWLVAVGLATLASAGEDADGVDGESVAAGLSVPGRAAITVTRMAPSSTTSDAGPFPRRSMAQAY